MDHSGGLPWHGLALVLMALAAVAALAITLYRGRLGKSAEQGQAGRPAPVGLFPYPVLAALAGLMAAAGGIHLAVTREHFIEDPVLGWFFLLLTIAQIGYAAVVLVRPSRALLGLGLLSNVGVVALWVYTRTVGIPFGVGGGEVEAVGLADVVSAVVELAAAAVAVQALRAQTWSRARLPRLSLTHAGWALMVVAIASSSVSAGGHA